MGIVWTHIYSITLLIWTSFFSFSLYYEYDWFLENIWARRINPLVVFASFFFTWKAAHRFSPKISYIMLANPFTYISEGMRATLIGDHHLLIHGYV